MRKKVLAFYVSICLLSGLLPATVQAAPAMVLPETYTVNLNRNGRIAGIGDPDTGSVSGWSGSKIVYGSQNGSPILWRVLDAQAEEVTQQNVMLLHSDAIVYRQTMDTDNNPWASSEIRAMLNDSARFLKDFQAAELSGLYSGGKAAEDPFVQGIVSFNNPSLEKNTDRVFLLSAAEAMAEKYGYKNELARKHSAAGAESSANWLLRSQRTDTGSWAVIDSAGKLTELESASDSGTSGWEGGIAPALYLDTSSILFTSPAGSQKPQSLTKITKLTGDTSWKLTLCTTPNSLNASLAGGSNIAEPGSIITVSHGNASMLLPGATQVSAFLTDAQGQPLFYGKIGESTTGTSNVPLPSDLLPGTYQLYVFAEDIGGNNETDYASCLGNGLTIQVKAVPVIRTFPSPGAITYGQALADSPITGGLAVSGGTEIPGSYRWSSPSIRPVAADSNSTSYEVIFTPQDTVHYKELKLSLALTVNKVENAPNMPSDFQTVEYTVTNINQIALPDGWTWRGEDSSKELPAGGSVQVIARYHDVWNYQKYEQVITVSRKACSHTGGVAACTQPAICDICRQPYGNTDSSRHGETYVLGQKDSSCTETGYTGDTYCKVCGQLIAKGQEIGIDSHYYNNERTLKWVNCTEKGEVEHYCSCGDSYTVEVPALGHDYESRITTAATSDKDGVKTYTCKRCKATYTEKIPRLSSGGSQTGGSGTGNSGAVSIPDNTPFVKGNSSVKGWDGINKEIRGAAEGSVINISMNNTHTLPAKTLETLKGKNVTLVLDIGNNMKWSIAGSSVTAKEPADLKLAVVKNSASIPKELAEQLAGERDSMQLTLSQEGEFGCTASLQLLLDSKKAGYFANLFHYNTESQTLEHEGSVQMDGKGYAELPFTHASSYLIVLDTKQSDGAEVIVPEPTPPQESPIVPVPSPEPEKQSTVNSTLINVLLILALTVTGIGLITVVAIRARKKRNDE